MYVLSVFICTCNYSPSVQCLAMAEGYRTEIKIDLYEPFVHKA